MTFPLRWMNASKMKHRHGQVSPLPPLIFFLIHFHSLSPPLFHPPDLGGDRGQRVKDRGRRAEGGARGWQCGRGGASERASEREREKEKREKNRFPGNSSLIRSSFFFLLLLRILDATPASILFHWGPGIWWFENFLFFHTHTHTYIYI